MIAFDLLFILLGLLSTEDDFAGLPEPNGFAGLPEPGG